MSEDQDRPVVTTRRDGAVALITLDRPPLNALNLRARRELDGALDEIEADEQVRAVVIHGAGGRAFSVGSDIREFDRTMTPGGGRARAEHEHRQYNRIAGLPLPVLAAIEGYCLGGGLELALACDLRVATEQSHFGLPEANIGVFPGGGGTERLPEIVGRARAKELMFLGDQIDAAQALAWGIVNRVVPTGQAIAAAIVLAHRIAEQPARSIQAIKRLVDIPFSAEIADRLAAVAEETEAIFHTRDAHEGRAAFLEKRPPRFEHQ